jgi:hypothetical protein
LQVVVTSSLGGASASATATCSPSSSGAAAILLNVDIILFPDIFGIMERAKLQSPRLPLLFAPTVVAAGASTQRTNSEWRFIHSGLGHTDIYSTLRHNDGAARSVRPELRDVPAERSSGDFFLHPAQHIP